MTILAVLAVGCAKVQGPAGGVDNGTEEWSALTGANPIRFGSSLADPVTKTTSLPSNVSFGVFAFYQPGDVENGIPGAWGDGSTWTPNFMYDQEVEFDGTDYTYAPVKYWPNNEENTITFWAYYPYDDAGIDRFRVYNSATTYSNTSHNVPDIQYTTDGHTDFLVSDIEANQHHRDEGDPNLPNNPDATVHFTFHHAMSLISFKVQKQDPSDNFEMVLKTIRLDNIYFSGVHNQELGWIARLGDRGSLTAFTGDPLDPLVLHHPDGVDPALDPVEVPQVGDDPVIPLPQYLRFTSATLYVEYTLQRGGGSPVAYECEVEIGEVTHEWERDKHYTYNITINPGNPILFTADVVVWGAEQTAYYTFE